MKGLPGARSGVRRLLRALGSQLPSAWAGSSPAWPPPVAGGLLPSARCRLSLFCYSSISFSEPLSLYFLPMSKR